MSTFINQALPIIQTAFFGCLLAILALVGVSLKKEIPILIPKLYTLVVAKIGLAKTKAVTDEALKVWNKIKSDTKTGDFIGNKYEQFEKVMMIKFPFLTPERVNELNKDIAGQAAEMLTAIGTSITDVEQQGEVTPVAETPIAPIAPIVNVVSVAPIVKYVAPDGTELQPVNTAASI